VAIPAVGSELAGYRIDGLIGRGGMGVVYRATDLRLGRRVAIKLIAADRAGDPAIRDRFEREARLMAAIDHPNVVPIYAAGEDEGCLYLVMRYVAGTDLAALLSRRTRLRPAHAIRITEQLADALDAAHSAGLVHRDIKPANVLLAGQHAYLSDFGIGRAVQAGTRLTDSNDWLGTVDFCSPEQLRCEPVDARSDVYSLGCLLHAALTGTPPHHRETAAATMLAHLNDPPPPPSKTPGVPPAFDPVLACALAKRPADRFATAGELAGAARTAAGAPQHDPAGPPPGTARTPKARAPTRPSHRRSPDAETIHSGTGRLPGAIRTRLDLRPRRRPADAAGGPSKRTVFALAATVVALATAAAALSLKPSSPGPLTRKDIETVVQSFARAYGHRDARALGAVLAPGASRVTPSDMEHGRPGVEARYGAELADGSIVAYRLSGLDVTPGWVGRATARYAVLRIGRPTLTGQVAFGVERVGGHPEIGLIAIRPAG
jgi:serine/threonine-protein kinase